MFYRIHLKALLFMFMFAMLVAPQQAEAGVFSDIKLWYNEKSNINKHSRVVGGEVKTLYRERKSIQSFAEGATGLVRAYQAIKNKTSKTSFPQLLEIARSITQVVSGFNNLAPKAEAMYKNAQPSMKYFAQLADQTDTIQTSKNRIMVKSFSDNRVNKLAGANGWSRVFDSIKSQPMNIFRWGRLSDEYKMGKIEAQYPLKCAQIAFEASAYYFAARDSVQELLGIQKEIQGIMGGDLSAILNMSGTINKIQNSGRSIESLGELAEVGATNVTKRFDELLTIQNQYVAANKAYNEKYNKPANSSTGTASAPTAASTVGSRTQTSAGVGNASSSGSSAVNLKTAMATYQKAYETYVSLSQSGSASQAEMQRAVSNLQKAKQQVERAKAQQAR